MSSSRLKLKSVKNELLWIELKRDVSQLGDGLAARSASLLGDTVLSCRTTTRQYRMTVMGSASRST